MSGRVIFSLFFGGVAFLSLFFFPYPATLVLSVIASISFPPFALALGILSDALYAVPSHTLLYGTLFGALGSLLAFFVRRFVKARIIS